MYIMREREVSSMQTNSQTLTAATAYLRIMANSTGARKRFSMLSKPSQL